MNTPSPQSERVWRVLPHYEIEELIASSRRIVAEVMAERYAPRKKDPLTVKEPR